MGNLVERNLNFNKFRCCQAGGVRDWGGVSHCVDITIDRNQ